jgi:hypothetical protein
VKKTKDKKLTNEVDLLVASLAKSIRDLLWQEKKITTKDSNFDLHINLQILRKLQGKILWDPSEFPNSEDHLEIASEALVAVAHQRQSKVLLQYKTKS